MSNLIKARRGLNELYRTGVEIRVGGRYGHDGEIAPSGEGSFVDEDGKAIPLDEGEIALWVQPPSPLHRDIALRAANAAKTRTTLTARRDEDSEEALAAEEFLDSLDDDALYEYVLLGNQDQREQEAIREVLADEQWADITELQESLRIFAEEKRPDSDPEVLAVAARERELQIQVNTRQEELLEAERDVLKMRGVENARKQAKDAHVELLCSRSFMVEYERQMTFHSVRFMEDHGVLFFESAKDMSEKPDPLIALIRRAVAPFIGDGGEAKN